MTHCKRGVDRAVSWPPARTPVLTRARSCSNDRGIRWVVVARGIVVDAKVELVNLGLRVG